MEALAYRLLSAGLLAGSLTAQTSHSAPRQNKDRFVGSKACFGCHSAIYRSFEKTDMGRSITSAAEWSTQRLPPQASITQTATGRTFEVLHNAAGWRQKESEPNVFAAEYPLEYAVGSGANGLTFLIRRGSYLFQAPLSYYSQTKKWDFSPGYEAADLGFSRRVPQECINCHAGRALPLRNQTGAFEDPPFQELAIGCENCHGPGGAHVESLGRQAGSIVNPAKLPSRLAENICMNCHQSGDARVLQPGKNFTDFHPGDWLFDTAVILKKPSQRGEQETSDDLLEHYLAMQASRCFRESDGKLGCLTCHDPHMQPRQTEVASYFRSKCLTCHKEQSCTVPLKARAEQSPPDDCAGCHMQKRSVRQVSHSALTNHTIPAREGEPVPPVSRKEIDGLVVVDAPPGRSLQLSNVTLLRAYGQLSADPAYQRRFLSLLDELSRTQPQDSFVQLALGHQALVEDRPEEAIGHLKAALGPGDAAANLEMGEALAKLSRYEEAIEYTKKAAELDPYNAVVQKTLILQYISAKAYGEARQHMERYIDTFPEDSFMRGLLAKVNQ